jgi:predicted HicB family RNase H-like nuclease
MLRIPPDVHGAALVAAKAAGTSLNQWAARHWRVQRTLDMSFSESIRSRNIGSNAATIFA